MAGKTITKNCSYCGKEFEAPDKRTNYCSPNCLKEGRKKYNRERHRMVRAEQKQKEYEATMGYIQRMAPLADFNAEARARHMTYGQYYTWRHFN